MLDTRFPRPPSDIGSARSFGFPLRYEVARGAVTAKIMGDAPDLGLLKPFIADPRELETDGVKPIARAATPQVHG